VSVQAAVLHQHVATHVLQAAVLHHLAATPAATVVVAEAAASKCHGCVAQRSVAQSSIAQSSACLGATSAVVQAAVHLAAHLVDQLASQAAVLQFRLHVPALATDIQSAKG